jgi:hypothetical protein
MGTLDQVLMGLYKFSKSEYTFYEGANSESVTELEKKLNFELPGDFKEFLLFIPVVSGIFPDTHSQSECYRYVMRSVYKF